MVRLKVAGYLPTLFRMQDFNSTMVRLKDQVALWNKVFSGFQFHYGTIKSLSHLLC